MVFRIVMLYLKDMSSASALCTFIYTSVNNFADHPELTTDITIAVDLFAFP